MPSAHVSLIRPSWSIGASFAKPSRDRVELRRRVQRAVVAALPRVDDHRAAARHVERTRAAFDHRARGLAADASARSPARATPAAACPGRSLVNSPCVSCSVVLPSAHVADSTRISGMPGCRVKSCAMSRIGLPAAACICAPQVVGHRVAVGVLLHVAAHALAPGIGADDSLRACGSPPRPSGR